MNETMIKIEFNKIREMLCEYASSDVAKEKCLELAIELNEVRCKNAMRDTTEARKLLDCLGQPPISSMQGLQEVLSHSVEGYCLSAEQLMMTTSFLISCGRMKQYLKRSEYLSLSISGYGSSIEICDDLRNEIERCIRNHQVDDNASTELKRIRGQMEDIKDKVKIKLEQLLRSKPHCFADSYISMRNGHYVLPVKKEYKSQFDGTVFDKSSTGNTIYLEPVAVGNLQREFGELLIAEENEVRRILYMLTAMVYDNIDAIRTNISIMCDLDFIFAKGKLSQGMKAMEVPITTDRNIKIVNGRHPLIPESQCVPLNFCIGGDIEGIIITGPNTGGKTVALKTVGLLSMMAQCGLHVPVEDGSSFCMHNVILCDMGDGQSIEQNLSTFSSHINRIITILGQVSRESLVLLDELGSGTDPAEGMGIAISIVEELKGIHCLFVATTHYPEVKEYAKSAEGIVNARMAFDKESLQPLYQLEIGEAGESCALYIAKRLGLPQRMLEVAYQATYGKQAIDDLIESDNKKQNEKYKNVTKIKKIEMKKQVSNRALSFTIGDSVVVYPEKKIGIVCKTANEQGEILVQVQKKKKLVNHKRLKLKAKASDLYPEDYDFSIIFDTVENRKIRKKMTKRHDPNLQITSE